MLPLPCRDTVSAFVFAIAVATLLIANARAQGSAATIWDGVYTAQQAERGRDSYTRACSGCHGGDLSGRDDGAPALRGAVFTNRWKDRPLSEMYLVIAETMPEDAPASLKGAEYADIMAFLLKSNDIPAGAAELPSDSAGLKRILFIARTGSGRIN